jgi:hypothetical protein
VVNSLSTDGGAFYLSLGGGRFTATELTRGPWSADSQHAGPPAALLGRAVEHHAEATAGFRVCRMTFEILRPVPLGELSVSTRSAEVGRSVERVEAALEDARGRVVMRATALRIREAGKPMPEVGEPLSVPAPEDCGQVPFYPVAWDTGYHTAMDFRFASGGFLERGPATAWARMRAPLVAGEPTSGLCRVLTAADSGNGISSELDFGRYLFVNADLNVHLLRNPVGEWVGLDARTTLDVDGVGIADTLLLDGQGAIGRSSQSLFIAERG